MASGVFMLFPATVSRTGSSALRLEATSATTPQRSSTEKQPNWRHRRWRKIKGSNCWYISPRAKRSAGILQKDGWQGSFPADQARLVRLPCLSATLSRCSSHFWQSSQYSDGICLRHAVSLSSASGNCGSSFWRTGKRLWTARLSDYPLYRHQRLGRTVARYSDDRRRGAT